MMLSPFVDQKFEMILARLDPSDLRALAGLMEDGAVTPVLDRLFEFDEVPDAIRYSESGRARGKIVVSVD